MTIEEMVRHTRQALENLDRLPPEVQFRQLIAWGIIDEKGEVLFGRKRAKGGAPEAPPAGSPAG